MEKAKEGVLLDQNGRPILPQGANADASYKGWNPRSGGAIRGFRIGPVGLILFLVLGIPLALLALVFFIVFLLISLVVSLLFGRKSTPLRGQFVRLRTKG